MGRPRRRPEPRGPLIRPLLNQLLYFPTRGFYETPDSYEEVVVDTEDGERLVAWWVPGGGEAGHVLLFHGNGGNIGDRVLHARLLTALGFDVLLAEYRGYGQSTGRPSEEGTYRDARATLEAMRALPDVDGDRVVYLGESLGGAVALWLALREPPRGLVLHTAFTSVRDVARVHYPVIPPALVPDAYPSLSLIRGLAVPLLVTHGDRDEIVPYMHAEELFAAAPEPKRMEVFPGAGHNDLLLLHGERWAAGIADWAASL